MTADQGNADADELDAWGAGDWQDWLMPVQQTLERWRQGEIWRRPLVLGAGIAALLALAAVAAVTLRPRSPIPVIPAQEPPTSEAQPKPPAAKPSGPPPAPSAKPPVTTRPASAVPLTAETPGEQELQALLEAWLEAKAAVLAGRNSAVPLEQLARDNQLQRLQSERGEDAARGQTQRIETTVSNLEVESSSPRRIAVLATIGYSDQRLDGGGQPVGEPTRIAALRNRYVFARDGGTWRLVSFQRAG
jgi:hypothetical protein